MTHNPTFVRFKAYVDRNGQFIAAAYGFIGIMLGDFIHPVREARGAALAIYIFTVAFAMLYAYGVIPERQDAARLAKLERELAEARATRPPA